MLACVQLHERGGLLANQPGSTREMGTLIADGKHDAARGPAASSVTNCSRVLVRTTPAESTVL